MRGSGFHQATGKGRSFSRPRLERKTALRAPMERRASSVQAEGVGWPEKLGY